MCFTLARTRWRTTGRRRRERHAGRPDEIDRQPAAPRPRLEFIAHVAIAEDAQGTDAARQALDRVPAVWARRLWPGALPPDVDPRFAGHCQRQSRTAFFDTLSLLEGARWVNPLQPMLRAESKLLQLKLAQEVGLSVPDTVVTNAPDDARALYERTGKRAVTKLLGALSQTMNASGDFVYTSVLADDDVRDLDGLNAGVDAAVATLGRLDIVSANGGIASNPHVSHEMPPATWNH